MKIANDKYYTSKDLAFYCVEKTKDFLGIENITEYLEPSAGNGVFLEYLDKPFLAYDFELPLQFGKTKDGFYFGHNRQILYIPCFSEQNLKENEDAYDNTIKIIYNDGKGNETVVLENVECKIINDEY